MILRDKNNGDLQSLRRRLDEFLAHHGNSHTFMLAFDAALMFAEDRNFDGRARFSQCLNELPDDHSTDTRYVALFCHFNLSLDDEEEWKNARLEALALDVDPLIKSFLRFPSAKRIEQITEEARRVVRG